MQTATFAGMARAAPRNDAAAADATRHDAPTKLFHWASAMLVVTLFAVAQIICIVPDGSRAGKLLQSIHVSLGVTMAATLILRMAWRASYARRLPPAATGLAELAAHAMHYVLYGLLVTMVVAGFGKVWSHGDAVGFFGLFSISAPFAMEKAWQPVLDTVHSWGGWSILGLAGLHGAAALYHHFRLHDGVLRRMLPERAA